MFYSVFVCFACLFVVRFVFTFILLVFSVFYFMCLFVINAWLDLFVLCLFACFCRCLVMFCLFDSFVGLFAFDYFLFDKICRYGEAV